MEVTLPLLMENSHISRIKQSALLVVGHGSTENPDSSTPYFDHADEIRAQGVFAEVHCCFWKEEPSMREALYMIDAEEVFVEASCAAPDPAKHVFEIVGAVRSSSKHISQICLLIFPERRMVFLLIRACVHAAGNISLGFCALRALGCCKDLTSGVVTTIPPQAPVA